MFQRLKDNFIIYSLPFLLIIYRAGEMIGIKFKIFFISSLYLSFLFLLLVFDDIVIKQV